MPTPARLHDAGPPLTITLSDLERLRLRIGLVNSLEVVSQRRAAALEREESPEAIEILTEHLHEIRRLLARLPISSPPPLDPPPAMPGDIVERLNEAPFLALEPDAESLLLEAGAEIERLRAMLVEFMEAHWTLEDRKQRAGWNPESVPPQMKRRKREAWERIENEAGLYSPQIGQRLSRLAEYNAKAAERRALG